MSLRLLVAEDATPLPKLETVTAIRDAVAQLIADVHAKMNSRVAANLAPLLNLQMRAIETTDLERRIAKVERLLAKTQSHGSLGGKRDAGVKPNGSSLPKFSADASDTMER
jgi:hypothetical protein